jgi:hypothetical protein
MRAAPAVDAALDGGGRERMLITLLHGLAGAALAAWAMAHAGLLALPATAVLPWLLGLGGALAMAAVGAVLARRALPAHAARLRWDGTVWQLVAATQQPLCRIGVSLDLGSWLLLRLQPADGAASVWRIASQNGAGPAWHALRVALQAHAGEPAAAEAAP